MGVCYGTERALQDSTRICLHRDRTHVTLSEALCRREQPHPTATSRPRFPQHEALSTLPGSTCVPSRRHGPHSSTTPHSGAPQYSLSHAAFALATPPTLTRRQLGAEVAVMGTVHSVRDAGRQVCKGALRGNICKATQAPLSGCGWGGNGRGRSPLLPPSPTGPPSLTTPHDPNSHRVWVRRRAESKVSAGLTCPMCTVTTSPGQTAEL